MDHLFYLTDINGPRLSGSPQYQKAAEWTVNQLKNGAFQMRHWNRGENSVEAGP